MEEDFNRIVGSLTISGDVSRVRAFAKRWAVEHPIRYAISGRETALDRVLEREAAAFHSTGEVVADLTTAVDDLGRRLELYSDQLPRQARWQVEYFKSESLSELRLERVFPLAERAVGSAERAAASADRLAPMAERALDLMEGAPKMLLGERDAVVKSLRDELTRTTDFVDKERIAALEYLTNERVAALNEMREALAKERAAVTQDMEHISLKVVDHAFWRATQLLAVVLVALFVALVAVVLALRRSARMTAG
jgi:hypothetical protein